MAKMHHSDLVLFRRLLQQSRPYWAHVVGTHPLPWFLDRVLPESAAQSPAAILAIAIVLLLGVAALENLFALANSFLRTWTAEKLLLDFRSRLFSHLQRLSLGYHDLKCTTDSVYRIQYDTASMQYLAVDGLGPFVTSVVTLLVMFYVTFRIDAQLA